MFNLMYQGVSIQTELEYGVYIFPNSSADGKTYLGSLLRSFGRTDRVTSYTYDDTQFFDISVVLDRAKYDMVLIDRYDMYFGVGLELIKKFGETGLVLIDCKSNSFPFRVKPCHLIFEQDRMVIFG